MSQEIDEGGSASGMSLREWYAGMAMIGLLASCDGQEDKMGDYFSAYGVLADSSFEIADAMITARKKQ